MLYVAANVAPFEPDSPASDIVSKSRPRLVALVWATLDWKVGSVIMRYFANAVFVNVTEKHKTARDAAAYLTDFI